MIPWFLILYLNHRNQLEFSKAIMVVTSGFTITVLNYLFSYSSGVAFYFVAASVGTFCLYSSEEKKALIVNTAFYLLLYFFCAFFFDHKPVLADLDDDGIMEYFRHSSFLFTLILTSFFIYFLTTENKEIGEALLKSKEKAEKADRAKSKFISMMSHEIRTPISTIIGFSDLLMAENDENKRKMYLKNLRVSGNNLLKIVNEILDLSALEYGHLKYNPSSVSIHDIIEEILPTFIPLAAEKDITVHYKPSGNLALRHYTDGNLLNQLLINLIHNAIKFTDKGTVSILLMIGDANKTGISSIDISIKDTGIGFDPMEKETIFDRFSQVSEDINRKYGGTGLGLSIVQELLKVLGGDIYVDSQPGIGSEFMLHFQFKIAESEGSEIPVNQEVISDDFTGKQILIAEDDPFNAMITKHLLEDWKIEVTLVSNGREAIDAAGLHRYDAILMDIQMPDCDGIAATQQIRDQESGKNKWTPIIGYTANISHDERVKGLKSGMSDYLIKPVPREALYLSLKKWMV